MTLKRTWVCHFCLKATEVDGLSFLNAPQRCCCGVVSCDKCGSFLREDDARFCHGCGTVAPKVQARFTASDSTLSVYVGDAWQRRNKGSSADGEYGIATHLRGEKSGSHWLCKRGADGRYQDVRELTPEECALLGM
jgi:hypothetical protein